MSEQHLGKQLVDALRDQALHDCGGRYVYEHLSNMAADYIERSIIDDEKMKMAFDIARGMK